MFFKKKNKNQQPAAPMPGWVQDSDGNFRLDLGAINGGMPPRAPEPEPEMPVLERLYVISRDNINLDSAQDIVQHAAMNHEYGELLLSRVVPLVWCAAYPDELYGDTSLQTLLLGYANQQEGEKYLNSESKVMPVEGNYNGYDYYILALVR